jgi:hypothetical protein
MKKDLMPKGHRRLTKQGMEPRAKHRRLEEVKGEELMRVSWRK